MLTLFTIPKPFDGADGVHQRNAIRSWGQALPGCEIFLCGDDPGVVSAAAGLGAKSLTGIETSPYGTPLLSSVFGRVHQAAAFPIFGYVNADIIFLPGLAETIQRIPFERFLAVGRRTNLDLAEELDLADPDWHQRLRADSDDKGVLFSIFGIDYFFFTAASDFHEMPSFIVGRPRWDNWFIFNARRRGVPVVDLTRVCLAIHQNHDYAHIPHWQGRSWLGPETDHNNQLYRSLVGQTEHHCNIQDATHVLTTDGVKPALNRHYLYNRLQTAALFTPLLRPLAWLSRTFHRYVEKIKSRAVHQKR